MQIITKHFSELCNFDIMKKKDKDQCTYGKFIELFPYCTKEKQEDLLGRLRKQPRPKVLCGKDVPDNLSMLTYGELDDMQTAASSENPIEGTCKILLKIDPNLLLTEDVNDVFGFSNFVTEEVKRINKIFSSIKPSYSREERAAGVESLNFGSFGVLDWYAQRMHIANQNEVRNIAWVRIYQCMRNDSEKNEFERRLYQIYSKGK